MSHMKNSNAILFLDFDGPLYSDAQIRFHPMNKTLYPGDSKLHALVQYWKMSAVSVEMLNQLYDIHEYQVVVSSTWRLYHIRKQIVDLFAVNGLKAPIVDDPVDWRTKCFKDFGCQRASEIGEYIHRNDIKQYIILDDMASGSSLSDLCDTIPTTSFFSRHINKDWITLVNYDSGMGCMDFTKMTNIIRTGWSGKK